MDPSRREALVTFLMFFTVVYFLVGMIGGLCLSYSHQDAGVLVVLSAMFIPCVLQCIYFAADSPSVDVHVDQTYAKEQT